MTRETPPPGSLEGEPAESAEQFSEDELTDEIASEMGEGLWTATKARALAERSGAPLWKVRKLAAVASLALRRQIDVNELAVSLLARLERTYAAAMAAEDFRAAVAALRTMAEVSGLGGVKGAKVEELPKGSDPMGSMPPEFREVVEQPDLLRFWTLHERRPNQQQRAELLDGRRHPGDPCGRPECAFCNRAPTAAPQPH